MIFNRFKFRLVISLLIITIGGLKSLQSQTLTDSNLPIVVITTDGGVEIQDEPRIGANMTILFRKKGHRNYLSDISNPTYLNYKGRVSIERRGSSSQWSSNLGKFSYGFETQTATGENYNVSLIGMPSENDWVLNACVYDKTLIRNMLSYELSNRIGRYAPRTQPCEVILNGDYLGIFILTEKIKRDKNRVDIAEMKSTDNSGQNLTGGYIYKIDKSSGSNNSSWSSETGFNRYQYDYPDETAITVQQKSYLKAEVNKLEKVMSGSNPEKWADSQTGYPSIIDVRSFTDQHMLHEMAGNLDMLASSMFYYKDKNGKIASGPIWDHDLGYGNNSGYDAWKTNVFFTNRGQSLGDGPFYYQKLMFNDKNYRCQMSKRWHDLRAPGKPLNTDNILACVDSLASIMKEADEREQIRWKTLGRDYFGSPSGWKTRLTYQSEIDYMKTWIKAHLIWLDANLTYSTGCNLEDTPDLVINEIMYHALGDIGVSDSDEKYDYIELKNSGGEPIQMQGLFFSSGITYTFEKSVLETNTIVVLASDSVSFKKRYGFKPFGQYFGSLSNKSERLIIETAKGTAIDSVFYLDNIPWPNAEATHNSIELKSDRLNNNLPANWFMHQSGLSTPGLENGYEYTGILNSLNMELRIKAYPNPLEKTSLTIVIPNHGTSVVNITTLTGQIVFRETTNQNRLIVSNGTLKPGVYILNVTMGTDVQVLKLIVR